jgi:hypothetical protein
MPDDQFTEACRILARILEDQFSVRVFTENNSLFAQVLDSRKAWVFHGGIATTTWCITRRNLGITVADLYNNRMIEFLPTQKPVAWDLVQFFLDLNKDIIRCSPLLVLVEAIPSS